MFQFIHISNIILIFFSFDLTGIFETVTQHKVICKVWV